MLITGHSTLHSWIRQNLKGILCRIVDWLKVCFSLNSCFWRGCMCECECLSESLHFCGVSPTSPPSNNSAECPKEPTWAHNRSVAVISAAELICNTLPAAPPPPPRRCLCCCERVWAENLLLRCTWTWKATSGRKSKFSGHPLEVMSENGLERESSGGRVKRGSAVSKNNAVNRYLVIISLPHNFT